MRADFIIMGLAKPTSAALVGVLWACALMLPSPRAAAKESASDGDPVQQIEIVLDQLYPGQNLGKKDDQSTSRTQSARKRPTPAPADEDEATPATESQVDEDDEPAAPVLPSAPVKPIHASRPTTDTAVTTTTTAADKMTTGSKARRAPHPPKEASHLTTATAVLRRSPASKRTGSPADQAIPVPPSISLDLITTAGARMRPVAQPSAQPAGPISKTAAASVSLPPALPKQIDLTSILEPPMRENLATTSGPATGTFTTRRKPDASATATPTAVEGAPVKVNRAKAEEIREKLKVDARRARLIVEFRQLYGPFREPEDLAQVSGITDEMIRRWEDAQLLDFE